VYNIDKARHANDPKLFKKLRDDIWEFRTNYSGIQYRLLAFWNKTDNANTLVIATHGIIKKTDKMPDKEIGKAIAIREKYLSHLKTHHNGK
jgi:phage-related protein